MRNGHLRERPTDSNPWWHVAATGGNRLAWRATDPVLAVRAPFDLGFLVAGCGDCGLAWPGFTVLDTVMLARQVMDPDEIPDCKLGTLAGFFGARTAPCHRALADARATADVLGWLIRRLAHRGVRALGELSAWPDVLTSAPA